MAQKNPTITVKVADLDAFETLFARLNEIAGVCSDPNASVNIRVALRDFLEGK